MLGDAKAELGPARAVDVADVDATQDLALGVDDDKVQGGALVIFEYPTGEAVIEVLEVFVTTVTNSRGEESSVSPLEPFQGPGVIEGKELQPGRGVHD